MVSRTRKAAIATAQPKPTTKPGGKSQLEIKLLHEKIGLPREAEIAEQTGASRLDHASAPARETAAA
jgi:hypothetical protein